MPPPLYSCFVLKSRNFSKIKSIFFYKYIINIYMAYIESSSKMLHWILCFSSSSVIRLFFFPITKCKHNWIFIVFKKFERFRNRLYEINVF
jgi:hypothetical protein